MQEISEEGQLKHPVKAVPYSTPTGPCSTCPIQRLLQVFGAPSRNGVGCAVMGREHNPHTYSLKVPPKTDNMAQRTAIKEDVSSELVVLTLKTVAEKQPET